MLLLSTSSLVGYWLHKIFLLAKEAGYAGIDLCLSPDDFDGHNSEYIKLLEQITGIEVRSITAYERKMNEDMVDETLKLASNLGIRIVNFFPPHRTDKNKSWFWEYIADAQKKYPDISLAIINPPPKTFLFIISEYGDARPELIKKITGNTALDISNVDPSSWVDLMKTFTLMGNSIKHIYLSDKKDDKEKVFPGEGDMPLESLLIKLKELGYEWLFSLRISPKELEAGDDEQVVERLREGYDYFKKYFI